MPEETWIDTYFDRYINTIKIEGCTLHTYAFIIEIEVLARRDAPHPNTVNTIQFLLLVLLAPSLMSGRQSEAFPASETGERNKVWYKITMVHLPRWHSYHSPHYEKLPEKLPDYYLITLDLTCKYTRVLQLFFF